MAFQTIADLQAELFKTDAGPNGPLPQYKTPNSGGPNAGALTLEPAQDRAKARAEWFATFLDRFRMARGIAVPEDVEDYLLAEIHRIELTADQARAAELYCLYDPWKYRPKETGLTLPDIVSPPPEAVKALAEARGLVVTTAETLQRVKAKAYQDGLAEGQRQAYEPPERERLELYREILDAKADVADLGEQLVAERRKREKAEERLEKLRQRIRDERRPGL